MTENILQAVTAFAAGVGTSLSPCVYPVIPITVGYLGTSGSGSKKGKVLGFVLGQVLAFTGLGVVGVLLGEVFGFSSEIPWIQVATGLLLLYFAYISFFDRLPAFLYKLNGSGGRSANSVLGAFVVGVTSATLVSPCTSPVVGGVLAAVSQVEERTWGMSLMFFFALGLSFIFLILGLGLMKVGTLPKAGRWMIKVHKASSVLLAFGGIYFILRGVGL